MSEKKKILFVDDEKKVLDGLRRMLFSMRNEWDMSFALGGIEGLEVLKSGGFDVVVSDMRMPEMDGAEFLNRVKDDYPGTARFILSGYSDRDMIMRTLEAADQFLTKPCDPQMLKNAINKAIEAQSSIAAADMRKKIAEMKSLPTLPGLYVKLKDALDSDMSSFKDISSIVEKDISVSAKVLQLVNSAFFGLRHRIDNLQHALTYLGIETLKAVVLTTGVFSQFTADEIEKFHINELFNHSIMCGMLAKFVAETMSNDKRLIDNVGMAAILHDIGKIVFIKNMPVEFSEVINTVMRTGEPCYLIEKRIMGIHHADAGSYLLDMWGLPNEITSAIRLHHHPLQSNSHSFDAVASVYVSNILVHKCKSFKLIEKLEFSEAYLARFHCREKKNDWLKKAEQLCTSMTDMTI